MLEFSALLRYLHGMPTGSAPLRPRRRDFQSISRRILDAARQIMAERGPEALVVSEVAQRAGINRSTAYQHFRTRDELVGAVMTEIAEEISRMLVEPRPLGERIHHMAHFFVQHPEIARLTLHQLLSQNPLPRSGWETYVGEVRRLTSGSRAQPRIDAERLANVLMAIGILWPLLARTQVESERELHGATDRLIREVERLLIHGALRPEAWPDLVSDTDAEGDPT